MILTHFFLFNLMFFFQSLLYMYTSKRKIHTHTLHWIRNCVFLTLWVTLWTFTHLFWFNRKKPALEKVMMMMAVMQVMDVGHENGEMYHMLVNVWLKRQPW